MRHVVYRPARLTPGALKRGYDWAYREFYRWSSIARASLAHGTVKHQAKQFFYAAGWKKFEPLWDKVNLREASAEDDAAARGRAGESDRGAVRPALARDAGGCSVGPEHVTPS